MSLTKEQGNFLGNKIKQLSTIINVMEEENKQKIKEEPKKEPNFIIISEVKQPIKYKYDFQPQPFRRFVRGLK